MVIEIRISFKLIQKGLIRMMSLLIENICTYLRS